jgi:hypothetical protein
MLSEFRDQYARAGEDETSPAGRDGSRRELSRQMNREDLTLMLFLATDEAR